MSGIYISYHQPDAKTAVGLLRERLATHFGAEAVRTSAPDADKAERDQLEQRVADCTTFLAVIGPSWLTCVQEPNDPVRWEIALAIHKKLVVIPVLIDGARFPAQDNLPPEISALAHFQGIELRSGDRLIDILEKFVDIPCKRSQPVPHRVFISAKSADYGFASELYRHLQARSIPAFLSHESLPSLASSDYRKEIDHALDQAAHMVVVTSSKENVRSPWVEAEWGLFLNEKRSGRKAGNLITMVVGGLQPSDLPASLRYYEVIAFGPAGFERILRYLGEVT